MPISSLLFVSVRLLFFDSRKIVIPFGKLNRNRKSRFFFETIVKKANCSIFVTVNHHNTQRVQQYNKFIGSAVAFLSSQSLTEPNVMPIAAGLLNFVDVFTQFGILATIATLRFSYYRFPINTLTATL